MGRVLSAASGGIRGCPPTHAHERMHVLQHMCTYTTRIEVIEIANGRRHLGIHVLKMYLLNVLHACACVRACVSVCAWDNSPYTHIYPHPHAPFTEGPHVVDPIHIQYKFDNA